jgi:dATP pyrophosphohydrolase
MSERKVVVMAAKADRSARFYAVSAYVVHGRGADARYLLLRRSEDYLAGNWQMVVGGLKKGETAWQAALREIMEETNLTPDVLYNTGETEVFYHEQRDAVAVVPAFIAFVADDSEVLISPEEHDAYEWLGFDEALARLEFPQQKRVIRNVHENFVLADPPERLRIKF